MSDLLVASAVVAYFGFPSSDLAVVSALCARVDDVVASLCNRPDGFLSAQHVERIDGMASDRFVCTYTPIAETPAPVVTVDGSVVSPDLYRVEYATGIVGMDTSRLSLWIDGHPTPAVQAFQFLPDPNFGDGFRNVEVTYTGGYGVVPLPGDLVQGAMELVSYMYRQRRRDSSLQSERLGDYSYSSVPSGWSDFLAQVTEMYFSRHIRHRIA